MNSKYKHHFEHQISAVSKSSFKEMSKIKVEMTSIRIVVIGIFTRSACDVLHAVIDVELFKSLNIYNMNDI